LEEVQMDFLRILAVDDEQDMLKAYQKVLCPDKESNESEKEIEDLTTRLFGEESHPTFFPLFKLVLCHQADEAIEKARMAVEEGKPFAVAFIDVRLPPGRNGVWIAERLRAIDPCVQIVMVTAYSDIDPSEIACRVPPEDKLLYVQKPFYPQEIRQFATALGAKWRAEKALRRMQDELEEQVKVRTAELRKANDQLQVEIEGHLKAEQALKRRESELEVKSRHLEEANTALKVLFRQRDEHKAELEKRVLANLKELVIPYIQKLKDSRLDAKQMGYVDMLESNLHEIISPFSQTLSSKHLSLTAKEIQVANLIKDGKTTAEIADLLGVSSNAVVFHRYNIRKKFDLTNRKVNLRSYLLSLP